MFDLGGKSWFSVSIRELADSPFPLLRRNTKFKSMTNVLFGEDDDPENVFRRVHVIPYQGDLLAAYIEAGKKCRVLAITFSTMPDRPAYIDSPMFRCALDEVLEDFEELTASGISPYAELENRPGPQSNKADLVAWIDKTVSILRTAPVCKEKSRRRISSVRDWLDEGYHLCDSFRN